MRKDKLIGMRLAAPAHAFLEQLAHESDRCVSNMARRILYERLSQIAAERGTEPDSFAESTAGTRGNASASATNSASAA